MIFVGIIIETKFYLGSIPEIGQVHAMTWGRHKRVTVEASANASPSMPNMPRIRNWPLLLERL